MVLLRLRAALVPADVPAARAGTTPAVEVTQRLWRGAVALRANKRREASEGRGKRVGVHKRVHPLAPFAAAVRGRSRRQVDHLRRETGAACVRSSSVGGGVRAVGTTSASAL